MKTSVIISLGILAHVCIAGTLNPQVQERQTNWTIGQTVKTTSGPVHGHPASSNSQVSEYLGILFAQPPIGELRFAPPVAYTGNSTINGTNFGFSCSVQSLTSNYSNAAAANITTVGLEVLQTLGNSKGATSEDCLTLNVWTKPQTGDMKKAVLVWIYGGGFKSGSSDVPLYDGADIADQEDVIVVSMNYRLNILGFPGSPTSPNNLGLLDQRLALEWVRDNIESFGGDSSRITLFGQSAGGASVDYHSYKWKGYEQIAAGYISESETVFSWSLPHNASGSAALWFTVTATLGCGGPTENATMAVEILACKRTKSVTDILDSIPARGTGPGAILGAFGPTADDIVVFSNYSAIKPAKKPMLIGNNDNEAGLFKIDAALSDTTFPDPIWDVFNLEDFTCPAGLRANASVSAGNPVWRYRYFGDFPDLDIAAGSGAWHGAEVPIIFDSPPATLNATIAEVAIGNYMRGAWAAFAKDPEKGLSSYQGGWPSYNFSGETLIRLAWDNMTGTNTVSPFVYDEFCSLVNVSSSDESEYIAVAAAIAAATARNSSGSGNSSATGTGSMPTSTVMSSSAIRGVSMAFSAMLASVSALALAAVSFL